VLVQLLEVVRERVDDQKTIIGQLSWLFLPPSDQLFDAGAISVSATSLDT